MHFQDLVDFFRGKYDYNFTFKLHRNKNKFYNHIISLGYNCEIAYRLYQYFGFEESSLFNWSIHSNISDLIFALKNFDKIGTNDFTIPGSLWKCNNTNIAFHGYAVIDNTKNKQEKELLENDKQKLAGKINYLKEKFLNILKDNSRKLYIYKVISGDINENINNKINKIIQILNELGGQNYDLLVITEEKYKSFIKPEGRFIYRTVRVYPPDNKVVDWKFNRNGFKKIFDEFWCEKPANYKRKHYKFNQKTL